MYSLSQITEAEPVMMATASGPQAGAMTTALACATCAQAALAATGGGAKAEGGSEPPCKAPEPKKEEEKRQQVNIWSKKSRAFSAIHMT